MAIQKRYFPKVYNYKNVLLAQLKEADNINEVERLDGLNSLTFDFPIKLFDYYGKPVLDESGKQIKNPKINYLINDNLIKFKDNWYIIKINEDILDDYDKQIISVSCQEIGYELSEKKVQYLNLSPPLHDAVDVETAFSQILEASQQIRDNYVSSCSGTSITLDSNAFPVDDYYNGYKIKILKGNGVGEEKTIVDYNGSTKTAILDSAFTTTPNSNSYYRIYNDVWRVGSIDSSFNSKLRSHLFEGETALDALNKAKGQYIDENSSNQGYLTYTVTYDSTYNKFVKYVNLIKPNGYNGLDIRYKKNMKSLNRNIDSEKIYTKMTFKGSDNLTVSNEPSEQRTDNGITYYTHVNEYNEIYNFQYFLQNYTLKECYDNFVKEYHFEDLRYVDSASMYDDGKELLETLSQPKVTYTVKMLDLSNLLEESGYDISHIEDMKIGDTIKIYNEDLGVNIFATLLAKTTNQNNPQNPDLELTNQVERMGDLLYRIMNRSDKRLNFKKTSGKSVTYVIADKATTKHYDNADFIVDEMNDFKEVLGKVIDYLPSEGGNIVLLDGVYNSDDYLNINNKKNISIKGQGGSTVIKLSKVLTSTSNIGFIQFSAVEDCNLSDFVLDFTNSSTYAYNGIDFVGANNSSIKNINILGADNKAINVFSSKNFLIDNITIDGVLNDGYGIYLSGTLDNSKINNITINNAKIGIYDSQDSNKININNIYIDSPSQNGIKTSGANGTNYDNVSIINSTSYSIYTDSTTKNIFYKSLYLKDGMADGVFCYGDACKFNDLLVDNCDGSGIWLTSSSSNVFINNATIGNNSSYGIRLEGNENSISNSYVYNNEDSNIRISGDKNTVKNSNLKNLNGLADYGIYVLSGSTDNILINNDLRNSGNIAQIKDVNANGGIVQDSENTLEYGTLKPVSSISSSLTLQYKHRNKYLRITGSTVNITVPANVFYEGDIITFTQTTTGDCTFIAGSGVIINSKDGDKTIDGQYASVSLKCVSNNTFDLIGSLKA